MGIKKTSLADYAARMKSETVLTERRIIARVAGVTFEGRQELLGKVTEKTEIKLERDRRNEYDFNAVKVLALLDGAWAHVGFLPAAMSKNVAKSLDDDQELKAGVHKLKGGFTIGNPEEGTEVANYGLDIFVEGKMK